MKWEHFSLYECTWEPKYHLPSCITDDFTNPLTVTESRLQHISDLFLGHTHNRLSQSGQQFYIYAELDLFRYLFGETGEVFPNGSRKLYLDDFRRLVLPINWYKFIYSNKGDGRQIEFPVSIKPVLRWSKKHYLHNKNNTFIIAPRKPVEVWKVEMCTRRYDIC